jgi:hypothetical protein
LYEDDAFCLEFPQNIRRKAIVNPIANRRFAAKSQVCVYPLEPFKKKIKKVSDFVI